MGTEELIRHYGAPDRVPGDYYRTPLDAVRKLLDHESFTGSILDPCCGSGNISSVLRESGYTVESRDLYERAYVAGIFGIDFLRFSGEADNVVCNPPYHRNVVNSFVENAVRCSQKKTAILLRLQFLESKPRAEFFRSSPLETVYVFSYRLGFGKHGVQHSGGMVAYAWYVWNKEYRGEPRLRWIT